MQAFIAKIDKFGEGYQMKVDGGKVTALPTLAGTFCSVLLIIIVIGYTVMKIDVLLGKKDIDILMAVNESFLDD